MDLILAGKTWVVPEIVLAIKSNKEVLSVRVERNDDVPDVVLSKLNRRLPLIHAGRFNDMRIEEEFAFNILKTSQPDMLHAGLQPDTGRNAIFRTAGFPSISENQVMGELFRLELPFDLGDFLPDDCCFELIIRAGGRI